jgi:hypothetical protein
MTVVQNKNSTRYLRGIMFVGSSSQRTQDFTTVRRETNSLGGYEDLDPHGYIQTMNPNSVCIFGHQINKEQLNLWMVKYWQYKKESAACKSFMFLQKKNR